MTVKEPHNLTQAEAQQRIQQLLASLQVKFAGQISNVKENWTGNKGEFSFKMMSFSITGELIVSDTEVVLESALPLTARPFKGMVEKTIRDQARQLLDA